MKHPSEQLLDYAYGELASNEAKTLEAHLASCPDCTRELDSIRGVRKTFAQLAPEPAPSAGLESLLAYAAQSAQRAQEKPEPRRRWFWLAPVGGLLALCLVVVVADRAQMMESASPLAQAEAPAAARQPMNKNLATFGTNTSDEAVPSAAPASPPMQLAEAEKEASKRDLDAKDQAKLKEEAYADDELAMRERSKASAKKKAVQHHALLQAFGATQMQPGDSGGLALAVGQGAPKGGAGMGIGSMGPGAATGRGEGNLAMAKKPSVKGYEGDRSGGAAGGMAGGVAAGFIGGKASAAREEDATSNLIARADTAPSADARKSAPAKERRLAKSEAAPEPAEAPMELASESQADQLEDKPARTRAASAPVIASAPSAAAAPAMAPPPPPAPAKAAPISPRDRLIAALGSATSAQVPGLLAQLCELDAREGRVADARAECQRLASQFPKAAETRRAQRVLNDLPASLPAEPNP
jgi:anti-sigma factor RsiW